MDQQIKTKLEENQKKPVELSSNDLEQVTGGIGSPQAGRTKSQITLETSTGDIQIK